MGISCKESIELPCFNTPFPYHKETPPDEKIHLCTNTLLYLLTRLLAISFGILDFDKLYSDIPVSILHTNPRIKGPVDERAFAILDSEEYIREKYKKEKK